MQSTTAAPPSDSSLSDVRSPRQQPPKIWARRLAIAVLVLVVAVGATGWLGVHSAEVTAEGGGYTMSVQYPRVARAGWDIPWTVTVTAPGTFPDEVTLAVTSDWFDLFESQGMSPQPSEEYSDATMSYFVLDTPPTGNTLTFDFDTYVQPTAQLGASADVWLIVDDQRVASVEYRTWLVP
ncbi:hypothetical protein SAMN05661080_03539 [Modestobacter sp. DSM 44400]|uniref:hypothetical protein n=1 Tax=Modestobacter sp. DSM 44400 TaxID=1550230 RepID=UPI0008999C04|nr:hypothetical protein [Modestobacter sp. DSM 44400]SDY46051.1 hypothetical protein SAMN05661080_03539 [Modestobacter sp. DSM 44400]